MQVTGKSMFFRKGEKITDHYEIGDPYSDSYYRKARIGVHKKTGIERAILQKDKAGYPSTEAFVKRFEYFSTFDHPNIVRYLEAYEDTNYYFVVCECLKGNDIIDQVWQRGRLSEEYAASILKQILQAVHYIHSKGISHNQLFPINILH
jgi:calcium/calmodulin-dependent protein kinase I